MTRYCLATVTSDSFAVGTEVLLFSFLRHNPWFDGEMVVIIDELSAPNRQRIEEVYPVRFMQREATVEARIQALLKAVPDLRPDFHLRLLSLETFRLSDYERVVFLDSDGLCCADLSALFDSGQGVVGEFSAARDGFAYEDLSDGLYQRANLPVISSQARYATTGMRNTFNTGMMSLGKSFRTARHYERLIAILDDHDLWRESGKEGFTDQLIINRSFYGQVDLLDGRYNFMPFMEAYIQRLQGYTLLDACFIHYAGQIKPWHDYDDREVLELAPSYLKYLQLWRDVWGLRRYAGDEEYARRCIDEQLAWMETGNDITIQPSGPLSDL